MKMLFMGRKQIAADALLWSAKKGFEIVGVLTDSHLSVSPTTDVAQKLGLKLFTLEQAQQAVLAGQLHFDIGVSVVYWRYLKKPLLDVPKYGILNFHPAPLPKYKGTAGYNWAILNQENKWSATVHYVDESIDTGPIVDQFEFSIDPQEETAQSLEKLTIEFMQKLYKKTLSRVMQQGRLPGKKNEGGFYTSRNEMEAMKELRPDDNWEQKSRAFWFPPYTGAYIEKDGIKYTIVCDHVLKSLAPKDQSSLFD
jgi:methionyl-tRNA formyltransferase